MTTEQIKKLVEIGEHKNLRPVELAQLAMEPPHEFSAADATILMNAFKLRLSTRGCEKYGIIPAGGKKARKKHEHTPSALVRAATKEFALLVSEKKRNGKFRRVGKKFIQTIEADLENIIRDIGVRNNNSNDDIPGDWDFVNHLRIWPKVAQQLNRAIRRRIFERVMSQPSIGKTLK